MDNHPREPSWVIKDIFWIETRHTLTKPSPETMNRNLDVSNVIERCEERAEHVMDAGTRTGRSPPLSQEQLG